MSFSEKMIRMGASQSMSFQLRLGGLSSPRVGGEYFLWVMTLKKGLLMPFGSIDPGIAQGTSVSRRETFVKQDRLTVANNTSQGFGQKEEQDYPENRSCDCQEPEDSMPT